jgi:hypothetical protein
LDDGVCRVDGIQRSVRANGGVADVLEIGANPAGVEVHRNDVVLFVEDEHEALFGVCTQGSFDGRKLVRRLPWCRVERLDMVKPSHAALTWYPHDAGARHAPEGGRCVVHGQLRFAPATGESAGDNQQDDFGIHRWKIAGRPGSWKAGSRVRVKRAR